MTSSQGSRTNPVACPTCDATVGEPCSTRSGHDAARPHKARREAPIPFGQHTEDCRAHAIGCAAENIAEWDADTRATGNTDPIQVGDGYLTDGTADCLCWDRNTAWAVSWIRKGHKIIAAGTPVFTTIQVDAHGRPVIAAPERRYQTTSARVAATHAAAVVMTSAEFWSAAMASEEHDGAATWTFTPTTGSSVRIRVTELDTEIARRAASKAAVLADIQRIGEEKRDTIAALFGSTTKPAAGPEPEPEPTVVGYVTIDATNPNWAPALALSAVRSAAELADADPESEVRTCTACGEPVEFYEGTGWVEVARDGHYDLCPERYIEATDTQRGHVVGPKPSPAAVEPATFICRCGDEEHPVVPGDDDSVWCPCGLRLDEQRERIADEAHDFETEGRQDERTVTVCAVCGLYRSAAVHG